MRHIQADFQKHAQRELRVFFDQEEIRGMEDWRLRILQGLRDSHLLLACLSPGYLASQNCKWEFNEYLKHEIGRAGGSHGVVPVYLVEVPSWEQKGDKQQNEAWADELRRRQYFDLRLWYDQGAAALLEAAVQERMAELSHRIWDAIQHGERAARSPGNVEAHNPHFVGRRRPLRQLRQNFVEPGRISVLTAVHGMGGLGKTALATEYAHAYAEEYGGGRWLVRCAGREDLRLALAELAPAVGFEFTEDEKKSADRLFERVRRELQQLAAGGNPPRCLLILDNVDQPGLLDPAMVARLNGGDWLHVLATTRLGENELGGTHRDRAVSAPRRTAGGRGAGAHGKLPAGGAISPRDGAGGCRRDSAAAGELHPGGGSGGGVSGSMGGRSVARRFWRGWSGRGCWGWIRR
ncbi:MAG: NB-ARC domain protein [Verrucomicrobia bacterium ADurb.Bin063]|nr:MAG: NB-ARC domain protein [Verrucomicrobia bacterium ADurb.Bin063]